MSDLGVGETSPVSPRTSTPKDGRGQCTLPADYARLSGLVLKNTAGNGSLPGPRSGERARDSSPHAGDQD